MASEQRFWPNRLRWRLRGAWTWPAFAAATLADGLILHLLPPWRTGFSFVPALIVSSFANLVLVGAVAPWLARRLRRGRPDAPPREVLVDRAATGLLAAGIAGALAIGLAARPATVVETEALEANAREVTRFVQQHAPAEVRANLDAANTIRFQEDGYFRNCVPYRDRRRYFCFFVDTKTDPPTVRRDPSTLNNNDFLRGPQSP